MLEVAIVGGGLCGLVLARHLTARGQDFALFEARNRLGGRILTVRSEATGVPLDLGPTWYWPHNQPLFARLVGELELNAFPQHDTGEVLSLADHDKEPEPMDRPNLHGGAYRIEGGMSAIVEAIAGNLPSDRLHLEHILEDVIRQDDHVVLRFDHGGNVREFRARHVVLAMPPRLLEESVDFDPPLDSGLREAMRGTYTWMADQAKAMIAYERPFWRDNGHSGNAFVHHEHTVIGEIFDACDASGSQAALGGFLALPIELRESLRNGMPLLISSQMVQVFGADAEHGEQHFQDWAFELFTCSTLDRTVPGSTESARSSLRKAQWDGQLHFGGSETASYGEGYLEGALEAAFRIQRAIPQTASSQTRAAVGDSANAASVRHFGAWVASRRSEAFERYRTQLHQSLAHQLKEQIAQRAVLGTMERIYSEALSELDSLHFDATADLTTTLLEPFLGFNKALLDEVLMFNRSSCALSNFPDEHDISPEYLQTIARDLAAAWREFTASVDILLLAKKRAASRIANAA